jgi:hypothetical protein
MQQQVLSMRAAVAGDREYTQIPARQVHRRGIRCLGLSALLLAAPVLLAQSGGGYDLHWSTQSAGGGAMNGANGYTLHGTIARPDATASAMIGSGDYALRGGFWAGVHETGDRVFSNGFEAPEQRACPACG